MTQEKAGSTSSAETDHSKPWTDIVRLGERIVAQLALDDDVDTLARWMSHRVAELLKEADQGDERARLETADLILRLWAHRSAWPKGWPPEDSEKVRRHLAIPAFPERPEKRDPTAPWLSRLPDLERLQEEEYRIWLRLSLVETSLDQELAQTEGLEDELEENELSFLRSLTLSRKTALEHFAKHLRGKDSPLARTQLASSELDDVQTRRRKLFVEAIAEADSSTNRENA